MIYNGSTINKKTEKPNLRTAQALRCRHWQMREKSVDGRPPGPTRCACRRTWAAGTYVLLYCDCNAAVAHYEQRSAGHPVGVVIIRCAAATGRIFALEGERVCRAANIQIAQNKLRVWALKHYRFNEQFWKSEPRTIAFCFNSVFDRNPLSEKTSGQV